MNAEDFKAAREKHNAIATVKEAWGLIERALANAQPGLALDLLAGVEPVIEHLGPDFIETYWPACAECGGLAEVVDPDSVQGRKRVCYIFAGDSAAGRLCLGNHTGRMHPVQLREYIEAQIAKRAPSPQPEVPLGGEPDQPPAGALGAGETTDPEASRRAAVVAFMDEVEACGPCRDAKAAAGVLCPVHAARKAQIEGLND
jgi:hypothetical protein